VFVASDLDIGMNDWMCRRLTWDDAYRPDRGKVLSAAELERIERFSRYLDRDGDGIAARTLPGVHPKGAYFTRGSGHDAHGAYTEEASAYAEVLARLERKLRTAADAVPGPEMHGHPDGAEIGIIALGSCHAATIEAVDRLRENGIALDYMRIRGFPFSDVVSTFLQTHERCFVVEQNRDAQLRSLLTIETGVPRDRMVSILDYGGVPLSAQPIVDAVVSEQRSLEGVPA
jgi:2-oxoglutarate ferredoxin oxidoreductase subunit alpha